MSEEKTLFKGSSSLILNLGTWLLCGSLFAASVVLAFLFSFWLFLLAGAAAVCAAYRWLIIRCRVYEVTTQRLRITTGILTRRTEELELYRVTDATLIEPFLGRLFGLGNILITTNDDSTPNVEIPLIQGARALREELRQCVEVCRDRKRVRIAEFE